MEESSSNQDAAFSEPSCVVPPSSASKPVRLQKYLAAAGVGSRRACEQMILDGRVMVNGQVVRLLGTSVTGREQVTVDGKRVQPPLTHLYIMLNKPRGYLCTASDTHGRRTVFDLLPRNLPRLFTVGRLDQDTEGLLLLTDDGALALRLTHPRHKIPKTYEVQTRAPFTDAMAKQLIRGVRCEESLFKADCCFDIRRRKEHTVFKLIISQGRKRQVRLMCQAVGAPVIALRRLAIGALELGNLRSGQWRYLNYEDIEMLFKPFEHRS